MAGILVHARGAGITASARTNARGIARFTFTVPRLGIVGFKGAGPRTVASEPGPRCHTFVGVLPLLEPPPLTGRSG